MLELNREQRRVFIENVPDAANVAAGALLFGQFLSDRPFSLAAALAGVGVWVLLMVWAVVLAKKGGS
jgi:hypothetical protein